MRQKGCLSYQSTGTSIFHMRDNKVDDIEILSDSWGHIGVGHVIDEDMRESIPQIF